MKPLLILATFFCLCIFVEEKAKGQVYTAILDDSGSLNEHIKTPNTSTSLFEMIAKRAGNTHVFLSQGMGFDQDLFFGMDEQSMLLPTELLIFPDKAGEALNIYLNVKKEGSFICNLYDSREKLIGQKVFVASSGIQEEKISLTGLVAGNYSLLTLFKDKNQKTHKTAFIIKLIK